MIRHLVFDFDGVLVRGTNEAYFRCYEWAAREAGISLSSAVVHERILMNWGESVRKEVEGLLPDHPDKVNEVIARDIELPVLFRFNGILRHRLKSLHRAFELAISEQNYGGHYYPAFPIKVNQQRHVVDVLRQAGKTIPLGLEVGSKPELIAVLGIHDTPNALLLCNGYKDSLVRYLLRLPGE